MSEVRRGLASISCVIKSGASLTATAVNLGAGEVVGLLVPAAWTAADITFSPDSAGTGTCRDEAGTELKIASAAIVAGDRVVCAIPSKLNALGVVYVRSGVKGVPVVQAADRTLTFLVRP